MILHVVFWIVTLLIAFLAGKIVSKLRLPAILGWLIAGMFFGPNAIALLPQAVLNASWYKMIIMWMQCAFGLMLGTELVWRRIKSYGKALVVTTLTQSLGTFLLVSMVFGIVFQCMDVPVYLAFAFGGIALATAPAFKNILGLLCCHTQEFLLCLQGLFVLHSMVVENRNLP